MKLVVLQYQKLHPEIKDDQTVTTHDFKRQMAILKKEGFVSICCIALYNSLMKVGKIPNKPVLITFDGGHVSQYRHAIPILENEGFSAIFFVTAESVLKSASRDQGYIDGHMNTEHLRFLQTIGFEIGFHGYANMNFKDSDIKELRVNIIKSKSFFDESGLTITNALAYPFGIRPNTLWKARMMDRMLAQEKILLAFTKGNKVNDLDNTHRFNIHRFEVRGKDAETKFLAAIR